MLEKQDIEIIKDEKGKKIVVIPQIIFKGKRTIDWKEVEKYLKRYVGKVIKISESKDIVYIGRDFPDEYKGSQYTARLKGGPLAKVKANIVQGIVKLVEIAPDKNGLQIKKEKHRKKAANGWYRYTTYFTLPILGNDNKVVRYNIFKAVLIVRCSENERLYLYDIIDIKKETSTPLWTN